MENKSNDMFKMDIWHKGEKINAECIYDNEQLMAWVDNDLKSVFQCTHCNELHTEDDFYPNKYMKSGHSSWCKKCISIKGKEQRAAKKNTPVEEESEIPVETDVESVWTDFRERLTELLSSKSDFSESEISHLYDRNEELERENQALRESNEKLNKEILAPITEDDLNDNVVVAYLKKHEVPLRILIEAITAHDNGIEITVFDSNTGLTRTVKYETPNAA